MDEFEKSASELEKRFDRMQQMADNYASDIVKYFDRLNDKLFTVNSIYIAAYLGLVAIRPNISKMILFIPLANSLIMVFIDWLMMEASRRMSKFMDMTTEEINAETKKMSAINLIALVPIITTLFVTAMLYVYINYYL